MLKVENITKEFTKKTSEKETITFLANDNISFTAKPGEVVGILGPNGAGKTTLLRIIAGIMEPSKGTVTIDDKSGIKLLYTNAVITAKIDNRTNKIVSAKWSYDVIITVDNTKIKAFGIPITLDGTEVVIRFEATL